VGLAICEPELAAAELTIYKAKNLDKNRVVRHHGVLEQAS
jgi:hypothetical protein